MRLPFLDRVRELSRLRRALDGDGLTLVAIYGRRRLGKSRLVEHLLDGRRAVYYAGDERDAPLQRDAVAREIARLIPGFADVRYPGWDSLLERFDEAAPTAAVLALDELPAIVQASPELPSLLQKLCDRARDRRRGLVLCGSSQRMMQGLLLDGSAPLYGRAREIIKVEPLAPRWLKEALHPSSDVDAVESYAVWGGVPRYWELCSGNRDLWHALRDLVLDPLGILQGEPLRLLRDDLGDVARASSVLSLVGQGASRASEIASRLAVPATSLSRPLARLVDLGFVARDTPFGTPPRSGKRSLYRVADPFLCFHYRFVEPNRSWLAAGREAEVLKEIRRQWPVYLGQRWEQMAREATPRVTLLGRGWGPAARWWGKDGAGQNMELDIVAEPTDDPSTVLVGEAKLSVRATEVDGLLERVTKKAQACPALREKRIVPCLFALRVQGRTQSRGVFGPGHVLSWG
jgi:hypothetical protein